MSRLIFWNLVVKKEFKHLMRNTNAVIVELHLKINYTLMIIEEYFTELMPQAFLLYTSHSFQLASPHQVHFRPGFLPLLEDREKPTH